MECLQKLRFIGLFHLLFNNFQLTCTSKNIFEPSNCKLSYLRNTPVFKRIPTNTFGSWSKLLKHIKNDNFTIEID